MKKKMVTMMALLLTVCMFAGCGAENETADSGTVQTVSTEENLQTETEEVTEQETEQLAAETETEEKVEDERLTAGMEKIYTMIDAYNELIHQHKYVEDQLQYAVENLKFDVYADFYLTAGDGNDYTMTGGVNAVLSKYYFDYVNNGIKYGDGYGDFNDLAAQIPSENEIMNSYNEYADDTNDVLMMEAIRVTPFLNTCSSIQGLDVVETTDYVLGDYTSAYVIPLDCDGNTDLTAVFDADGNLLNIRSGDNFPYVFTDFTAE